MQRTGEDGINQYVRADNFCSEGGSFGVARGHRIGSSSPGEVVTLLQSFHNPRSTDCTRPLCHHIQYRSVESHFPSNKQPKSYCRVYVSTCIIKMSNQRGDYMTTTCREYILSKKKCEPEIPSVQYTRTKIIPPKDQAMPKMPTPPHGFLSLLCAFPMTVATVTYRNKTVTTNSAMMA